MKKKKPDLCSGDDVMDELGLLRMAEYLDPFDDNDTLCNAKLKLNNDRQINRTQLIDNKGIVK